MEQRLQVLRETALSKGARDCILLDLRGLSSEVDAFLICHGTSARQVKAIAEAIEERLREIGERPLFVEGLNEASWVLLDCADVVIHIFQEKTRDFYRLEDLWSHAPLLAVPAEGNGGGEKLSEPA